MEKIIVLGPTAIGKSAYALDLAKKHRAAIVSADALQVYKYMDIGTAKLSLAEQQGITHYMIDIVEPSVQYSVGEYIDTVKNIINEHEKTNKDLIFCGGTGLYLNALINGLAFPVAGRDENIRKELSELEKTSGKEFLWGELNKLDPEAAKKIHPNDSYRTKRALEVYRITGRKFSELAKKEASILGENYRIIGLTSDRKILNNRVEERVDQMIEKGLVAEVKSLLEKGYSPELSSMQAIGYKEIVEYLQDKTTLPEAIEQIKTATRQFVKRQYTWFRAFKNVEWLEV
jgi:tRNA dimethylallyltransferase